MATATAPYSDEKIFVDPVESEKEASVRESATSPVTVSSKAASDQQNGTQGKEAAADNAPEAVVSASNADVEEKVALKHDHQHEKQLTLQTASSEKQLVSTDDVPSPSEHPPSYTSPDTQRTASSHFPSSISRSYREYSFYHAAPWRPTHNIIVDPENCAAHFIEVSEFSKGKQDVSIHNVRSSNATFSAKRENLGVDEGKTCPVVAFAQFPHGAKDQIRLGIGSAENMASVNWFSMGRGDKGAEPWRMVMGGGKGKEKIFEWRAGRSLPSTQPMSDDSETAMSPVSDSSAGVAAGTPLPGTLQFVEVATGEVIAAYTELKIGRSLKKRGKLRLYEEAMAGALQYEKDVELLIMLSIAAMNEKKRRKTWKKWASMGVK